MASQVNSNTAIAVPAVVLPVLPLIIENISISQDAAGRYCINDLHRAAGGEKRHQPSNWLQQQSIHELITELSTPGIPGVEQNQPVVTINGGNNRGTYVCKELVYAYAMWISPKFNLRVIRAFDALAQGNAKMAEEIARGTYIPPQFHIPKTIHEALRLAADLGERAERAEAIIEEQKPKVDAFDKMINSEGAMTITAAAKTLDIPPHTLAEWLRENKWTYYTANKKHVLAFQDKIKAGYMYQKLETIEVSAEDGTVPTHYTVPRVFLLTKGIAKINSIFNIDNNDNSQGSLLQ